MSWFKSRDEKWWWNFFRGLKIKEKFEGTKTKKDIFNKKRNTSVHHKSIEKQMIKKPKSKTEIKYPLIYFFLFFWARFIFFLRTRIIITFQRNKKINSFLYPS